MSGLVVDLFAGGGGASLGLSWALGREPDIAVNHDPIAIALHEANHPQTVHYCQNVWAVEPIHATGGRPVDVLWASPDCKHFSKAKGGKPKCQNIRDLAWVVIKWAKQVHPRIIFLENVEEFTDWGPLGPDKKPIESLKGTTFQAWKRQLQRIGYQVQHRELRACDYGAPTIRKRLFLIARRDGLPIVWPKPTHGPGRALPWRTAAECIDWTLPCPSIFERAKPLAENTLKRIARGIDRFVVKSPRPFLIGASTPFVSTYYGPKRDAEVRGQEMDDPLATATTENRHAVVTPFVVKGNHTGPGYECFRGQEVLEPLQTVTQSPGFSIAAPVLMTNTTGHMAADLRVPVPTLTTGDQQYLTAPVIVGAGGPSYSGKPRPADQPMGTMLAENHHGLVSACLVPRYGERPGQEPRCRSVDDPVATVVPTSNQGSLAVCVLKHYGGVVGSDVRQPLGTVTSVDHNSLCTAHVLRQFGRSVGSAADEPVGAVMPGGGGKTHVVTCGLVDKYYGSGVAHPVDEPLGTATAADRFSLAEVRIAALQEHADEVRALLIRFRSRPEGFHLDDWDGLCGDAWAGEVVLDGAVCRIVDIGLRMFEPRELFRAQSFPDSYKIAPKVNGKPLAKKYQTKACGNSVPPVMAKALARANCRFLDEENEAVTMPPLLAVASNGLRVGA